MYVDMHKADTLWYCAYFDMNSVARVASALMNVVGVLVRLICKWGRNDLNRQRAGAKIIYIYIDSIMCVCVKIFWYIFKIGYIQLKQLIQIDVMLRKKNTYYSLSATEDAYGKEEEVETEGEREQETNGE